MKESYRENLASSSGHKPYAGSRNAPGVAWVRGDAGQPLSSEIKNSVCRPCPDKGKATSSSPPRQGEGGHGGVVEPEHVSKFQAREPGDPSSIQRGGGATLLRQHSVDRPVNVSDGSTGMHAARKSDGSVVPAKSANKGGPEAPAEWMEERDPAERNTKQADLSRAQNRSDGESHGVFGMRHSILGDCVALDSRQEPYEVVPHVRICAGGRRQRRFLPQSPHQDCPSGGRQSGRLRSATSSG
jgi:hypothetical protein